MDAQMGRFGPSWPFSHKFQANHLAIPEFTLNIRYLYPSFIQISTLYQYFLSKTQQKTMFWCKPQKDEMAKTENKSSRLDQSWSKRIQTQHSQRIVIKQGYQGFNRLRGEFKREIEENSNKVRDYTDNMKYLKKLSEIQRLPSPQFYFSSIKKYFAANLSEWEKDESSNIIVENIVQVYQELAKSRRAQKQLTACAYFYTSILKQVLSGEDVGDETYDLLKDNGQTLKSFSSGLMAKYEDAIKLAKRLSIKEKELAHREEQGIMAELREMKAHIKGMAQQRCGNHHHSNHNHHSLRKEDLAPQFEQLRRLIEVNARDRSQYSEERTPRQKVLNKQPERYEENEYSREQPYSQINRYWINENGVKDIYIAELENNVNYLTLKLEQAEDQIQRLENYNKITNIRPPKDEGRKVQGTACHLLQSENQKLRFELKQKSKAQLELMHKNGELVKKIRLLQERLERHMKMEQEHHKNMCCLSKKIAKTKELEAKNAQLMKEIARLSETIIGLQRSLAQINEKNEKRDVNCGRLMAELEAEKRRNKDLSENLEEYREKLDSLKEFIDVGKRNIFAGDLLDTRKEEKKFLLETIQKEIGKSIRNTKFIYDFRRDNKVNFNIRIDRHENLVLILKTKNALIGCFYAGLYEHKTPLEGVAILMSLDNKKYYPMKSTKGGEGMVYDYDFLIYGREELMIEEGKEMVSSNFGIENGYFDNKGDNVHALLREGTARQAEIINYQIYEAYFQGEDSNKDKIVVC